MLAIIQQHGSALFLPLPDSVIQAFALAAGSEVEIELDGEMIRVRLHHSHTPTLQQLLGGVTDENLHSTVEFGAPTGREHW